MKAICTVCKRPREICPLCGHTQQGAETLAETRTQNPPFRDRIYRCICGHKFTEGDAGQIELICPRCDETLGQVREHREPTGKRRGAGK